MKITEAKIGMRVATANGFPMTIEQIYGNPYAYARATMDRSMTDREQSIWMDSCVANWAKSKKRKRLYSTT